MRMLYADDYTLDMERVTGSQGEARCKIMLNGELLQDQTV